MGMAGGEVEPLTLDGGSGGQILDGEFGTKYDGDDNNNIFKNDVLLSGCPHITTTGTSLGRIMANFPPNVFN